ncbi:hypothetical protein [Lapidilactobacillus luobeiensis]|uniref:hypothetical protein n=1 Tax=Lapidilactobacillus luobeiensis TaxID=2950371 RepID=UPI0021C25AF5|nr:hypothetical protein [Lapidilactobacillus luobeiensis]
MKVTYNLMDRKPVVKALEKIMGAKSKYLRIPTSAYEVDYFTVTCEGNLEFNDMADNEEIARKVLLRNLSGNSSWKGGAPNTVSE